MDWARDWTRAIERNSEALRGIIETLFALLGLDGEARDSRIPKPLHSAVLRVLRPAESAVRRLIVIAARGLVVKLAPSRPVPKGSIIGKGGGSRPPSFQLCDPRKDFPELRQHRVKYAKNPPRILFFGDDSRVDSLWPSPQPFAAPVSPPDALSMPDASAAGSRRSSWRWMICRVRPGAWPAGGQGGRPRKLRSSSLRSGRVRRPAIARGTFTRSMKSSSTATGSHGRR